MRAKQSSTADGTYSGFAPPSHLPPDFFSQDVLSQDAADLYGNAEVQTEADPRRSSHQFQGREFQQHEFQQHGLQRAHRSTQAVSSDLRGEGLLHDARNLVSAIGLYCDLLSMPGVLKPEHKQYPEELRLLGTRSRVLIEHLLRSLVSQNLPNSEPSYLAPSNQDSGRIGTAFPRTYPADLADSRINGTLPNFCAAQSDIRDKPVTLRATVERCRGLLSRVANDRPIEVIYGAAADVPVWVSEEAIERILVNLVRNASQALDREPQPPAHNRKPHSLETGTPDSHPSHRRHRQPENSTLAGSRSAIRISVGPLLDRIGEARSWPFQHVRLVVEDSGCGMEPRQLQSLLSERMATSTGTHGIGFRVVRELVAVSNGDLRAASTPGIGTRIQIEWPVAATSTTEKDRSPMERQREQRTTLKSPALNRKHSPIPASTREPATIEGRQGAY